MVTNVRPSQVHSHHQQPDVLGPLSDDTVPGVDNVRPSQVHSNYQPDVLGPLSDDTVPGVDHVGHYPGRIRRYCHRGGSLRLRYHSRYNVRLLMGHPVIAGGARWPL